MSKDVIKEFLVSLGYKVDGSSERKFKESVEDATKTVAALAAAAAAAAAAVAAAVVKISSQFDQLYFSSQRVGASATNIRAFSYAVSQMGGTAAGAQASLESLGRQMRNPGVLSLIRSLGVATEQNGKRRDTVEILSDLGKVFARMPRIQADQYANLLGIDDATMTALIKGPEKFAADYKRLQKELGADNEKAAENANKLMTSYRDLLATLDSIITKIASDLSEPLSKAMKEFGDWLKEHQAEIRQALEEIGGAFKAVMLSLRDLVAQLKPVWEGFDQMSKALIGQDGLTTAFEAFAVYLMGSWLTRILGVFNKVRLGWLAIAAIIASDLMQDPEEKRKHIDGMLNNPEDNAVDRSWFGQKWHQFRDGARSFLGLGGEKTAPITKGEAAANAKESYLFWRSKGLSHEAASALLAKEQNESSFNPAARDYATGTHHGMFQWEAARRADIAQGTGINISAATHRQQLDAAYWEMTQGRDAGARKAWETLQRGGDPGVLSEKFTDYFLRPGAAERPNSAPLAQKWAEAAKAWTAPAQANNRAGMPNLGPWALDPQSLFNAQLGGGPNDNSRSVTLNQKTEINVVGGTIPGDVASEIAGRQSSVNSGLLRNVQGAVR